MRLLISLLIVLLTGNLAFSAIIYSKTFYKPEDYELLFENFIEEYKRNYKDENEKQLRYDIFKHALEKINELNLNNDNAVFGINKFTDYTEEEFEMLTGSKKSGKPGQNYCKAGQNYCKTVYPDEIMSTEALEDSFDWRDKNVVTAVKDQRMCDSSWAFSVTGTVEADYAKKTKELIAFSEQQLVDCDTVNYGCAGGNISDAVWSLLQMRVIMTEKDYPYVAKKAECAINKDKMKAIILGFTSYKVTNKNEDVLRAVLKIYGPLSIEILAGHSLMYYKHGILNEPCSDPGHNHAVLLVGWGSENGVPYWILKNSWGSKFGEQGYFRLKRYVNSCCLMERPTYTVMLYIKK